MSNTTAWPATVKTLVITVLTMLVGSGWCSAAELMLLPVPEESSTEFGYAVATDGDYAIVGYPQADEGRGHAYIYFHESDVWTRQTILSVADDLCGGFGTSVDIHGDTAIVGAPHYDNNVGAAYIFVRSGESWGQQAMLQMTTTQSSYAYYGISVSVYPPYAIVGSHFANLSGLDRSGGVWVYHRSGSTWSFSEIIQPTSPGEGDLFGVSVDLFGLGYYAIVGAPTEDDMGAAYIFDRLGGTFAQGARLAPSDRGSSDHFGYSVAGNGDATFAVVGSPQHVHFKTAGGGAAYVYHNNAGSWSSVQEIRAPDATLDDRFGEAVEININTVLVGAPEMEWDDGLEDAGAVYTFSCNTSTCSHQGTRLYIPGQYAYYGCSIGASANQVIVGAWGHYDPDRVGYNYVGAAFMYSWGDLPAIFHDGFYWGTYRWSAVVGD